MMKPRRFNIRANDTGECILELNLNDEQAVAVHKALEKAYWLGRQEALDAMRMFLNKGKTK